MGVKRETEKSFMATVVAFAKLHGWLVYHTHDSRRSEPGFPDLVMVRDGVAIFAELKMGEKQPTAAQVKWLDELGRADLLTTVWRPEDWTAIRAFLGPSL